MYQNQEKNKMYLKKSSQAEKFQQIQKKFIEIAENYVKSTFGLSIRQKQFTQKEKKMFKIKFGEI